MTKPPELPDLFGFYKTGVYTFGITHDAMKLICKREQYAPGEYDTVTRLLADAMLRVSNGKLPDVPKDAGCITTTLDGPNGNSIGVGLLNGDKPPNKLVFFCTTRQLEMFGGTYDSLARDGQNVRRK